MLNDVDEDDYADRIQCGGSSFVCRCHLTGLLGMLRLYVAFCVEHQYQVCEEISYFKLTRLIHEDSSILSTYVVVSILRISSWIK